MFERDKDDLRTAGFVILADAENEGYYRLDRSATFAAPLDLTAEEAAAVRAAASALLDDPSFPFTDDLRLALAKIASAVDAGDVPAAARLADEDPRAQGAVVAQLADAAGRRKRSASATPTRYGDQRSSRGRAVRPLPARRPLVPRGPRHREGRGRAPTPSRACRTSRSTPRVPSRPTSSGPRASTSRASCGCRSSTARPTPSSRPSSASTPRAAWRAASLSAGHGDARVRRRRRALARRGPLARPRLLRFVDRERPRAALSSRPMLVDALRAGLEEVVRLHG